MKKLALIPVYNEESTLASVIERLLPRVDLVIIVDDGSSDRSVSVARDLASTRDRVELLRLSRNCGMSAALWEGFVHIVDRLERGELHSDDILLTLDADGQHDPGAVDAFCEYMEDRNLDVALMQRDFSLYPIYKRFGNYLLTLWGSLWSGYPYRDVESGFRGMRLKVLKPLLGYYTGYRYSCAQEIAVLTARLRFRVDNSFVAVIRVYRSQTQVQDVLINGALGLWAYLRCGLRWKVAHRRRLAQIVVSSRSL